MFKLFQHLFLIAALVFTISQSLQSDTKPNINQKENAGITYIGNIFPKPDSLTLTDGQFSIIEKYTASISGNDISGNNISDNNLVRLHRALTSFNQQLQIMTGVALTLEEISVNAPMNNTQTQINIYLSGKSEDYPSIDTNEQYKLRIDKKNITIIAHSIYGAMHGLQSLLQLANGNRESVVWPAITINDQPRFRWRGLLQDVVRHWMPTEVIKRQLDAMAAVKMNVFHWHLTDDQSFRVESKLYPNFHLLGSDGNYYTQQQIKEIVEYAADRAIRVVPEFDLPGHSRSWQIAYPQLSSVPGKTYHLIKHEKHFADPIDPTREENYQLLAGVIGEMSKLFPDQYFHIGGDEVDQSAWENNPSIRDFMRDNNINSTHELQSYFLQRYQKIVAKLGKIAIGWDEIVHSALPNNTVLNVWSTWFLHKNAAAYPIVVSRGFYLDSMQTAYYHHQRDPLDIVINDIDADTRARVDRQILGAEVSSWAETINQHTVDMRNWPRTAAAAERFWSPKDIVDNMDATEFYTRLNKVSDQLQTLGLKHRSYPPKAIKTLAHNGDAQALAVLASVVEPTRYHNLYEWKNLLAYFTRLSWFYNSPEKIYPVERFLENIPPESETARIFNHQVDRYLDNQLTAIEIKHLQAQLILWRDNEQRLQSTIDASTILKSDGLDQVSKELSKLAKAGLDALTVLESGKTVKSHIWRTHQRTVERLAFEYFTGDEMVFLRGRLFKPRPLRLHNLPVQKGVAKLLEAASKDI